MTEINRRSVLNASVAAILPAGLLTLVGGCQRSGADVTAISETNADGQIDPTHEPNHRTAGDAMQIHYLEIVTPDAEGLCSQYATLHGITFAEPEPNLGGARTAKLAGGTTLGIRPPMRDTETPVIRPYVLVDDINESVKSAESGGAEIALPPMEIPGHGTCAIVIRGGIECGFWQV